MVAPSKHAVGLISKDGVELLIHIGLETVDLHGNGFELAVQEGDEFDVGDKLLTFDLEELRAKNICLISPIVVTNSPDFLDIIFTTEQQVTACKNKLFMLIK